MTEKFILDATAGFRMMWFNKHEPHTIYLDCRKEVNPDVVGDFRDLSQFPDESLRLIVFDPQHRRIKDGCPQDRFPLTYGPLLTETWPADFKRAFAEMWSKLTPYGLLVFKWSTHRIKAKEVLRCFPVKPLFGQRTAGTKGNRKSKTFWFLFMKIPEEALLVKETQ